MLHKVEGQNWMHVIMRPSSGTTLKIDVILYWTSLHGSRNQSVNTVKCAILKCKLKLYDAKKKPYMIPKQLSLLWAKAHIKWSEAKWRTVLRSD